MLTYREKAAKLTYHGKRQLRMDRPMTTRPPTIAGTFYPASPSALNVLLDRCWRQRKAVDSPAPKAIIAPHAGLVYSGPIAASAYAPLAAARDTIERVVLLGPSHHFGFDGFAIPATSSWATPLGIVPIDQEALAAVADRADVTVSDRVHEPEHSLEIHLPLLQRVLSDFKLVPIAVGRTTPAACGALLATLWGGDETRIVISSDLSHFFDQATAERVDAQTTAAIERLDAEGVLSEDACGRYPICGLLSEARRRGMRMQTVDVRTSGDTAGDKRRVVGYGSYLFWSGESATC